MTGKFHNFFKKNFKVNDSLLSLQKNYFKVMKQLVILILAFVGSFVYGQVNAGKTVKDVKNVNVQQNNGQVKSIEGQKNVNNLKINKGNVEGQRTNSNNTNTGTKNVNPKAIMPASEKKE